MKAATSLLLAAWLMPGLGYVLPAERVVRQLEQLRQKQVPLRIEAELSGVSGTPGIAEPPENRLPDLARYGRGLHNAGPAAAQ